MADLTITADSVAKGTTATVICGKLAGENMTAGQSVYLDSTTGKWLLADADAIITTDEQLGITLGTGRTGQPVAVQTAGDLDLGATLTIGEVYVVSAGAGTGANSGTIAPYSDLVTGDWLYVLGVATAADNLKMRTWNTATQIA